MTEAHELKKISSSATLIAFGQVISLLCQFLIGILVVRIITPTEFGLLSLTLSIIGIFVAFTNFGMGLGLPRTIARQAKLITAEKIVGQSIVSALFFSIVVSLIFTILLYAGADKLTLLFNKDGLAPVLKILSFLVPPLALLSILGGIFQGLELTRPTVIFSNICLNLSKAFIVLTVFITGLKFKGILAANLISAWLTGLLFMVYLAKKLHKRFRFSLSLKNTTEILQFSFPLLGVQLLGQLITWAAMLLLGYFHPANIVGLYAAPLRLVSLLLIPLQAVAFLYLPIVTRLMTGKEEIDISELYTSVTKWIAILTLPMALVMILDSRFIVTTLFGQKYLDSAPALAILSFAYSFHSLLGPNGMTLLAFGSRKPLLYATAIGGFFTTFVCLLLIPKWGATGAALAVCTGMILSNAYVSITLYKSSRIHALKSSFFKPTFLILFISLILFTTVNFIGGNNASLHVLIYLALVVFSLFAPFITRSISSAESLLLEELRSNRKLPYWVSKLLFYLSK